MFAGSRFDGWLRPGVWPAFWLLVVLAFVWRMPYAVTRPIVQVDEVRYSLPTVKRLLAGDVVLYVSGTNYGAPVQEGLAAVAFALAGESAGAFRLPTVLLGSFAVGVSFLALRRATSPAVALGIGLLLALAGSADARYTTFSHSCYATLLALVGCMQLTTLWLDQKRPALGWLLLGALSGVAFYTLKLAFFQMLVSLVWLWVSSDYFQRLRERLRDVPLQRRLRAGLGTIALGCLLLAPVLYRCLTRREVYVVSPLEKVLIIAALLVFVAAAILLLPTLAVPRCREWAPVAGCLSLFILIPLPAALWFQKIEQPRLAAQHIEVYGEKSYAFKHLHEWPNQGRLMIQGVVPALLIGRWDEVRGFEESEQLGWKAAVTVVVLAVVAWAGFRRMCAGKFRPDPRSADLLFIVPLLLTTIVLFPSWSLHSESSYRYLLPYLSGFYLLLYRCLEDWIAHRPRTVATLAALYFAYCAVDCYQHITVPADDMPVTANLQASH